jgi:hypothetical protein
MLPVVHALAGSRIRKRCGSSAECRPCFEHEYSQAALGQGRRRAQAGESAADNDDIDRQRSRLNA